MVKLKGSKEYKGIPIKTGHEREENSIGFVITAICILAILLGLFLSNMAKIDKTMEKSSGEMTEIR
jgi:hypothetical protein